MVIYLFNPEHDMALASFSQYYKSPAEIMRMRDDLSALPLWYAERGGLVLVSSEAYAVLFGEQCVVGNVVPYGCCAVVTGLSPVAVAGSSSVVATYNDSAGSCCPWGWDPALVHWLSGLSSGSTDLKSILSVKGISSVAFKCADSLMGNAGGSAPSVAIALPTSAQLERIRTLSGRLQCVPLLESFGGMFGFCGEAHVCRSLDDVRAFLSLHEDVILKAPWSGSGRGLTRTSESTWTSNLEGWVARILRTQGSIMAEPIYNKVYDFAMEFYMDASHSLSFAGYSLFETDSHGNYKANVLTSNERIVEKLTEFVPLSHLEIVKEHLLHSLSVLLGVDYEGYLGVDMMICEEPHESRLHGTSEERTKLYNIHPCVEINLRMNMGVVARLFYDRYVDAGSIGSYIVEHYSQDGEALEHDQFLRAAHPQKTKNGRISSGYFSLTPVQSTTRYQCYVLCNRFNED